MANPQMYFRINGTDIMPLIAYKGIKWTRNDIDAAKAGRTLSGLMYRGRVTMKVKLNITCRSLSSTEVNMLFNLIYPEYVTVEYVDPLYGERMAQFYSNNVPGTFCLLKPDGTGWWDDISFPLVER